MNDQEIASNWAKELLSRDNWCILDTETTGLGSKAEICQIAVLSSDGRELLNSYVKPTVPIELEATQVHGITHEALDTFHAPTFELLLWRLMQAVGTCDVVIYNAEFDLKLIRQSLRPHGIQLAFPTSDRRQCRIFTNGGSIHCAMHWYSQWVGEWNDHHQNYKWQRLPGGDHSALGDCKATLEVIRRMANG